MINSKGDKAKVINAGSVRHDDFTLDSFREYIHSYLEYHGWCRNTKYTFSFEEDYSHCYYEGDTPSFVLWISIQDAEKE